jgi:DNA (cytosine-5)-methyltransferase 1
MVGVDLFAGAGGLSLGATQAGIDVVLAVENDLYAAQTYLHNHPSTELIVDDIRNIENISISANGESTVLFGGLPCQGFSTSNQKTRNAANPTNWLFLEFVRIADAWRPDWVVFENVTGITETEGGAFLDQLIDKLSSLGYTISPWRPLNAVNYGVPQKRSRLFVLGSLHGVKVDEPEPLSSGDITVRDAISDLPDLSNGASVNRMPYKCPAQSDYSCRMRGNLDVSSNHLVTRNAPHIVDRYKHIPQGGNWEDIPSRLMSNYSDSSRCHTGIYRRLCEDKPSVVIGNYRKNMLIHPRQNRGLSVREAARLQSFPDTYEFRGSIGFQQQQVGNAVPPLLAEAVFRTVILH